MLIENVRDMDAATRAAYEAFARADDDERFALRLARHFADFYEPLVRLYGADRRFPDALARVGAVMRSAHRGRAEAWRRRDEQREITPDWFQRPRQAGYIAYVDRFAGTLDRVGEKLPYLRELGVTYLHLMPLLQPRPGPNDGGYAVADYRSVDPRLGTMDDLSDLAQALHERGMSLCIDLVLNHTAREHHWARRAREGDERHRDFYLTFPDRTAPDAYERTLPLVFPAFKPSNFVWDEPLQRWVWSTFNEWQWDLDYGNPDVFAAMLEELLHLVDRGVDVLRLDAVPFMWKRLGTDCQNQPEVHDLLQAYRAITRAVAPGVIFKAEAIVSPDMLVSYLGQGRHEQRECDLAYNNSLMVLGWSALASRRTELMVRTLERMPPTPPTTTWATYVRLHDDIGWAITDENAGAAGEDAHEHRKFLVRFYQGEYWESFARGAVFQPEANGEGRTSGTTASLAGIEAALEAGDDELLEAGIRRVLLLYSVACSFGGIPLIYMGDEIGLLNDPSYLEDPELAADNRWLHRPFMNWEAAGRRTDPSTVEGRLFRGLQALLCARAAIPALHGASASQAFVPGTAHVLAYRREHRGASFTALTNFSEHEQTVGPAPPGALVAGDAARAGDHVVLPALAFGWFSG